MLEIISRELASMNPAHERAIRRAERRFNAVATVHAKRLTIPAGIIGQGLPLDLVGHSYTVMCDYLHVLVNVSVNVPEKQLRYP
jgi:hypothetical protein